MSRKSDINKLNKLTNEELWKLFPIIISRPLACWKKRYSLEKYAIEKAVGCNNIVRISHIGSTAVPRLVAKPTIDILLEVTAPIDTNVLKENILSMGYIYAHQPNNPAPHMMFMKGYTPEGFKGQAYHLHVRYAGDWDEICFRDYLIAHPETAKAYGELKLQLKERYEFDRDAYTQAKSEFIHNVVRLARKANTV